MARRCVGVLAAVAAMLASGAGAPLDAQSIPIRTVPVASGDQFLMLPSSSMPMGGVRLAVDDTLYDPWVNPAKGVMIEGASFVTAPTFYSISQNGGGGRTLPVGGVLTSGAWFGGGALALQQIDNDESGDGIFFAEPAILDDLSLFPCCVPTPTFEELPARNLYVSGFAGRRLGERWAVGVGGSAARLHAMDGVDLLYAGADRIDQSGTVSDIRLGLYRTGARDRLALMLLHDRVSMEHDVEYAEFVLDTVDMVPVLQRRVEANEDRTRTWGAHLEWDRDLLAPGWRVGASATVNRKSHPKIPNYEIQNIPRDPGTTWAYEAAFGLARTTAATTFGLELALQPIWSDTWQEADAAAAEASGGRFAVGDRTIENEFFFTNVELRTGVSHDVERAGLQLGLEVRSYAYTLDQTDHVESTSRELDESWMEWTPTFGLSYSFTGLDLRYAGRVTTGTGRPGLARSFGGELASPDGADFIVAPRGALTLQDVSVYTHQISIAVPVR